MCRDLWGGGTVETWGECGGHNYYYVISSSILTSQRDSFNRVVSLSQSLSLSLSVSLSVSLCLSVSVSVLSLIHI